jgi:hypothetical protein
MDALLPIAERRRRLAALGTEGATTNSRLDIEAEGASRIVAFGADASVAARHVAAFDMPPPWAGRPQPAEKTLATADPVPSRPVRPLEPPRADIEPLLVRRPGIHAYDSDWQFPAITEEHAFRRMLEIGSLTGSGVLYVGYPWATLIDKLHTSGVDHRPELERFEQFRASLPATDAR